MLDDAVLVLEKIAPEDKTRIGTRSLSFIQFGERFTNEADA